MLIWKQTARFALHHSPTREQREILRSATEKDKQPNAELEAMIDVSASSRDRVSAIQSITRQKIAMLTDLAKINVDDPAFSSTEVSEFVKKNSDYLRSYVRNVMKREFNEKDWMHAGFIESLRTIFAKDIRELEQRDLNKFGPSFEGCTTNEDYFIQNYMRDVNGWDTKRKITNEEITLFRKSNHVPNAYIDSAGNIRINLADESLNYPKLLQKLRSEDPSIDEVKVLEIVERNRERAVVHELAHFALDTSTDNGDIAKNVTDRIRNALGVQDIKDHPLWRNLRQSVNNAFEGHMGEKKDVDILHEAIAISIAGARKKYDKNDPRQSVLLALQELLNVCATHDATIVSMLTTVDDTVRKFMDGDGKHPSQYETITKNMNAQMYEQEDMRQLNANLQKRGIQTSRYNSDGTVRTNAPEKDPDAATKAAIKKASEQESKKINDPNKMLQKIEEIKTNYGKLAKNRDAILAKIPEDKRHEEGLALDAMLDMVARDIDDLDSVKSDTEKLMNWSRLSPEAKNQFIDKWSWEDKGRYARSMNASSITALDSAYADAINKQYGLFSEAIADCAQFEAVIKTVKKIDEEDAKYDDGVRRTDVQAEYKQNSFLGQFYKDYIGRESGVKWLSWYDIVKIYGIYKDAIMEKYHSNQKMRTYDAAKEWNIWKPLQPDLDKQARSANDEETHAYKEFLEKEGFTYDQLFVIENNELQKNKLNVNRAKAVIEYAADHAWLYHLDRFNGHDVYGIDFEGIWGAKSFEHLVEHNNDKQDEESGKGYSRVNNYPDIQMIIDDMIEALEVKNLWQVHGMMKRLQEKAKLAESNTWAVATLMRAMRRHPEILEIMDIGMLDKIGGLGITQSAWTMTLYKTQRNTILDMKREVEKHKKREDKIAAAKNYIYSDKVEDNFIARVIDEIERKLPEYLFEKERHSHLTKQHETDYREVDLEIAKVLSGQTVLGKNGKWISIFDGSNKIFTEYRKYFMDTTNTTPTEPSSTDPDFYNPQNGGSDILLLGPNEIANNFSHTSQGRWTDENKALNLAIQIFMRDAELGKIDKKIQESYRKDMKYKLKPYFSVNVLGQAAAATSVAKYMTGAQSKMPEEINNKLVLEEFMLRGMLDYDLYEKIKKKDADKVTPILPRPT